MRMSADYDETLDFDVLIQQMGAMTEGDAILRDLSSIVSEEDIGFFNQLVSAEKVSSLGGFDTDTVIRNIKALFNSQILLQFVENLVADTSILSDKSNLMNAMEARQLSTMRRLL